MDELSTLARKEFSEIVKLWGVENGFGLSFKDMSNEENDSSQTLYWFVFDFWNPKADHASVQ